jgi:hypothetical protein
MKKIILKCSFVFLLISGLTTYGQVKGNQNYNGSAVPNSSAFLDASVTNIINNAHRGKGMIYPRADLSTMNLTNQGTLYNAGNNPNRFDGMIVYNTKVGGVALSGVATQGELAQGFWYYENKTTNFNGGIWRPFVATSNLGVKSKTVTVVVPANATTATLDLTTSVIAANEVTSFLGAKVYDNSGNLVMTADSAYDKATNLLTTGNGFMYQVLGEGTYQVVVEYR